MENDTTDRETTRESIIERIREWPWRTQKDVAEEVGVVRSWVSEVVAEEDGLEDVREAYRKGIVLDGDEATLRRIADAVELDDDVDDAVAERVRESGSPFLPDDVDEVRIELVPDESALEGGDEE